MDHPDKLGAFFLLGANGAFYASLRLARIETMNKERSSYREWTILAVSAPILYLLSSGPVLAASFWLRDATGWDGFYATMWLYFPLIMAPGRPFDAYIEWWVRLLGTVGPG